MKRLNQLKLKDNEERAIQELKERLLKKFPDAKIILYGSKARGNYEEFSDIDMLILLPLEVDNKLKKEIVGLAFDIELECDVVFGLLIKSKNFWNSSLSKAMPIHWNVDREGVSI